MCIFPFCLFVVQCRHLICHELPRAFSLWFQINPRLGVPLYEVNNISFVALIFFYECRALRLEGIIQSKKYIDLLVDFACQ
jgi:hypothetical protein